MNIGSWTCCGDSWYQEGFAKLRKHEEKGLCWSWYHVIRCRFAWASIRGWIDWQGLRVKCKPWCTWLVSWLFLNLLPIVIAVFILSSVRKHWFRCPVHIINLSYDSAALPVQSLESQLLDWVRYTFICLQKKIFFWRITCNLWASKMAKGPWYEKFQFLESHIGKICVPSPAMAWFFQTCSISCVKG